MATFILELIIAGLLIGAARYFRVNENTKQSKEDSKFKVPKWLSAVLRGLAGLMVLWAVITTSMVWVPSGKFATLKRIYFGKSLTPGQIVAANGELGPQARIITAGFHPEFMISLLYSIDYEEVFQVPNGKCAIMSAKDGISIPDGQAFADPWPDSNKMKMANDAVFFLGDGKGQRGPQTTVLTPASYTINPFLWETPRLVDAERVEQGTVGVVKSSVRSSVDFGFFKRPIPTDNTLKVLTRNRLPRDSAMALLVPVGAIGVWEEALPNGLYYMNTDAYRITMVPTVAQIYEYKGGYKKRTVDISVNSQGQIVEKASEIDVISKPEYADTAIFTNPEGWDVAQEMRVIVQISPEMAPFVVASLGLTKANATQIIEDRVVTPIIRSVTRDVEGGAQILFQQLHAVLGTNGLPVLGTNGEPKTEMVREFRALKVLDLLDQRASIEEAIEERAKPEALKEGVTINEVRLAESSIPPELLIARKREQLAQQLKKAWVQEELAQAQRQKTENARAQAEQQPELVKAEIAKQAAANRADARKTEGEGEKNYLTAVAEGQKVQAEVLGNETTARLQMFDRMVKAVEGLAEKNPQLISTAIGNAGKFVPSVVVSSGGQGSGLEGAAAIFGHLLQQRESFTQNSQLTNK